MMSARRMMLLAATMLLALAQPATAAPIAATVLLVTSVADDADYMPAALWRRLATQYLNARSVTVDEGTTLPDDARCRSAHAIYAVLARLDRTVLAAGIVKDPARGYATARFTIRNCVSGTSVEKTLSLVSDPLSEPYRGEFADNAGEIWNRPMRIATERDPLALRPIGRVVRLDADGVVLESNGAFSPNQLLRVFADANARPYPVPLELVVSDVAGKYATAIVNGKGTPRPGDYVEAQPR